MIKTLEKRKIERFKMLRDCLLREGYEQTFSVMADTPSQGGVFFEHAKSRRRAVIRPATSDDIHSIHIEFDPVK